MKGHIRQTAKGSWSIVIDQGKDPLTGKRRQRWHTVHGSEDAARKELRRLLDCVDSGTYVKPTKLTVTNLLTEWLSSYVDVRCTPRTKESYEICVRRHLMPVLGSIPLSKLEPRHVQTFLNEHKVAGRIDGKPLSAQTMRYCHTLLSKALDYGIRMGYVSRNVAKNADLPRRERKKLTILSPDNVAHFLKAAADTPYYPLFFTMLHTGMRRGEALALTWQNVDLEMCSLHVLESTYKLAGVNVTKEPKTETSKRHIDLTPDAALVLRAHRERQEHERRQIGGDLKASDLVFAREDGSPFDPCTVSHAFQKVVRQAGIPHIRLHDLRHSHASLMFAAGVHAIVVAQRLGHSSIRTTVDTYGHLLPTMQKEAVSKFQDFMSQTTQKGECLKDV